MRLAAALGMLAMAALAAGGVASLTAGRPIQDRGADPTPRPTSIPEIQNAPTNLIESHVEEAEHSLARARAAIQSARQLGIVDDRQLDALEHRLDVAAGLDKPSATQNQAQATQQTSPPSPLDPTPREL